MLDRISVLLKDFVIYIIPGILITYSLANIIGFDLIKNGVAISTNLATISLIFSFIFGFISSQLQIIVFWWFLSRLKKTNYKSLESSNIPVAIKEKIAEKIIQVFEISPESMSAIKTNSDTLDLCHEFLKIRASGDSISSIERDSYLSSFAISIYLPFIFTLFTVIKFFDVASIILIAAISIFFLILVSKIATNFKQGYRDKVYMQFYAFTLKKD
jgi:hypothetical protein